MSVWWWVVLDGGRVTSKEADISHQEKVTQIWQTDREPHTQTKSMTNRNRNSHKKTEMNKQQLSDMLYFIHLCFKDFYVLYLCHSCCAGHTSRLIWHFQDTDSKADFRFPPIPAFSWKQNICRKYLAANLLSSSFVSYLCSHLIFVRLYSLKYCESWEFLYK